MIVRLRGKIEELRNDSAVIRSGCFSYLVMMSNAFASKLSDVAGTDQEVRFEIFHYIQNDQSRSIPHLFAFETVLEKDFFELFITVSGVGPRAALKAFTEPVGRIADAIDRGDQAFLKSLPGIGARRALEIIAKLQGKVDRFCLLSKEEVIRSSGSGTIRSEGIEILKQLQYSKSEAEHLIDLALSKKGVKIDSVETLLNEVYRTKAE
ncbi:MAG: hypothetical protein KC649_08215 [Candidatus Omnitrophica bacterium]|nr:hypothetical protein [Candidatus Omnitrophota bacterium]